ncbi:MAG: hypothetical protein AB8V18_02830 [Francisella endosymbiont of Hyalomma asiaticum]
MPLWLFNCVFKWFFVKVSNEFFIFAFAIIPIYGSLQIGTASTIVSKMI